MEVLKNENAQLKLDKEVYEAFKTKMREIFKKSAEEESDEDEEDESGGNKKRMRVDFTPCRVFSLLFSRGEDDAVSYVGSSNS